MVNAIENPTTRPSLDHSHATWIASYQDAAAGYPLTPAPDIQREGVDYCECRDLVGCRLYATCARRIARAEADALLASLRGAP